MTSSLQNFKKILIIRFSSIGDIVLTSPIIRAVKQQSNAEVHFITKKKFAQVVVHNPNLEKVYTIDREITEVLPELKAEGYDLVIDLHKNLRSKRLILNLKTRAVSFDKVNIQKWLKVHLRIDMLPKKHLVDRYFDGLAHLDCKDDGEGMEHFHGLDQKQVDGLIPDAKYVAISLGATYFTKRIPLSKMRIVIEHINRPIVLLGGADVAKEAQQLQNEYPNIINKVASISLNESAAIVSKCAYLVTGDTGMMHIGAAYKRPIMMWWGSTHPVLGMYPYYGYGYHAEVVDMLNEEINCNPCSKIGKDTCPKGHFRCMLDTTSSDVMNAIARLEGRQ